jgi:hypothetical protein
MPPATRRVSTLRELGRDVLPWLPTHSEGQLIALDRMKLEPLPVILRTTVWERMDANAVLSARARRCATSTPTGRAIP